MGALGSVDKSRIWPNQRLRRGRIDPSAHILRRDRSGGVDQRDREPGVQS